MFSNHWKTAHPARWEVVAFFITFMMMFLPANNLAFANAESDAHNKLGNGFFYAEDYQKALEEYTEAINIDDKIARYFSNRAWTYMHLKNYNAAKADFDIAISLDDKLANAYRGRAELYNAQGNIDAAKKDFYKAGSLYYDAGE